MKIKKEKNAVKLTKNEDKLQQTKKAFVGRSWKIN